MIAQTWPIKVPIDVSGLYTKILRVSGANKATKTKNMVITKFSFFFFAKTWNSIFFCRSARGPKTWKYYVKCIC